MQSKCEEKYKSTYREMQKNAVIRLKINNFKANKLEYI